jgi:4-diphosphocytidyl-2-C-methyl-D-erythritol kinase
MEVRSYAKINWALRVTGKRADAYHDIETVFQTISLHDTLIFRAAERLSLTCSELPVDETNLVLRAARALGSPPVAITLEKRIPVGGGLGGGSSNAAATLVALAKMFDIRKPLDDIALALGSDVPFFLRGGTAYATGRGEVLTPLPRVAPVPLLLAFPRERVLTSEAYALLRHFSSPLGADRFRAMIEDDLLGHASDLINDFEEPIFTKLPQLARLKGRMIDAGAAWAGMSGSGSTLVGAFRTAPERDGALRRFDDVRAIAAETI